MLLEELSSILPPKVINTQTARLLRAIYDKLEEMNADVDMLTVTQLDDDFITCNFYCGFEMENPSSRSVNPAIRKLIAQHKLGGLFVINAGKEEHHLVYEVSSEEGSFTDFDGLAKLLQDKFADQPKILHIEYAS